MARYAGWQRRLKMCEQAESRSCRTAVSAKRGHKAKKWSAAALILSLFVLSLLIAQSDPSRVTYNGRAVEDWICNSDWEKERTEAEIAILMLGEKAVEPLRAILRLKSPSWAVSMGWKVPMGNLVFSRPLKNVVKKQQAIRCLEAVGTLGPLHEPLLPDLIMMAENEKEFLRLRQMALRYIDRQMPANNRLNAKRFESDLLSGTNGMFNQDWSLWESVKPEKRL